MDNDQLQHIVKGCKLKDIKAQEALYKHFYGYAMSVCLIYSQNKEDALEVLNDGFIKVFKHLANQKGADSFKPWVRRIMINTAIDRLRKNKHHRYQVSLDATRATAETVPVPGEGDASEILLLVQDLAPAYRMVFNLNVLEGFSHREIAEKLNISESTSRAHLSEANKRLRSKLQHKLNPKSR